MNGRFTPVDDLSNAFSLLSPRPFSRQAQYSSFSSSSADAQQRMNNINTMNNDFPTLRSDPFFRDRDHASTAMFDRHQRFLDEAFASSGRMSPRMTPMMPEWGYVGRASDARVDSPIGGRERIIPIRVEGARTESPQMSQRSQQERSVHFREDVATNGYRPSTAVHHEPVSSAVYANSNKINSSIRRDEISSKPTTTGSTGDLPSIGINLGKAPNLSSRLAKTTTFDEFADVLNRLPNRPESKRDTSLDLGSLSSASSTNSGRPLPPAPPADPPKRFESPAAPPSTTASRLQSSNVFGGSSGNVDRLVSEFERNVRVSSHSNSNYSTTTKREGFSSATSAAPFSRLRYLR